MKFCHALTLLQGRPRRLDGRWPCVTGLASYLSSCFSFTAGRHRFQHRPFLGGFASLPRVTATQTDIPRTISAPLSRSDCDTEPFGLCSACDRTPAGNTRAHWLTVATIDRYPITAFVSPAETQPKKPHSTRGWFLVNRFTSRLSMSLSRSPPDSHSYCRKSTTSSGGAGEICLEATAETAEPQGARTASQPQPFPGLAPGPISE